MNEAFPRDGDLMLKGAKSGLRNGCQDGCKDAPVAGNVSCGCLVEWWCCVGGMQHEGLTNSNFSITLTATWLCVCWMSKYPQP